MMNLLSTFAGSPASPLAAPPTPGPRPSSFRPPPSPLLPPSSDPPACRGRLVHGRAAGPAGSTPHTPCAVEAE